MLGTRLPLLRPTTLVRLCCLILSFWEITFLLQYESVSLRMSAVSHLVIFHTCAVTSYFSLFFCVCLWLVLRACVLLHVLVCLYVSVWGQHVYVNECRSVCVHARDCPLTGARLSVC